MPLRNQIPAKLSARSVYSKRSVSKETVEKGRGRLRKNSTSPTRMKSTSVAQNIVKKGRGRPKKPSASSTVKKKSNLQKKSTPTTRKRTSSVSFKSTTEIIENHSSEADLSSEGEDTDQTNDEVSILEVEVEQKSTDVEISDDENEQNVEEVESSGEEGDLDEGIDEEEESKDEGINEEEESKDDDDLASTDEIEGEQDESEDVCYSFPEPSNESSTNLATANAEQEDSSNSENSNKKKKHKNKKSQVQLKKTQIKDANAQKILNSKKRRITGENAEETEEGEQNEIKPKKKKKKLERANLPMESSVRSFSTPGSSISPQHHFNPDRPSASFHLSAASLHPHVDSIDSLIKFNKSVPCGNIAADQAFRWLIGPTLPVDFFHNIFEKMPHVVPRENRLYYRGLFDGNDLNSMFREHKLDYKVHIDVVKYVKGMRIPVSASGRAYSSNVWEDYKQGFSVRVRNPQAYNKNIWKLCSLLQEYFSSCVGCNVYLTPPKAQGFPPHYDDIDAFIIQVEGRKYWKVYHPRYPEENLARYSSKDFAQTEIGEPILQVCLNAGEMLYIPRGYIHQAATDGTSHSMHLTFSTNQLNTWGDLLLIAATKAVEKAILNDSTFRESISKEYMDCIGSSVADSKAFKRYELINKVKDLAKNAVSYIDVDEAADLHSLKYIEACLPPVFNRIEKEHSLHGNGSYWRNGEIKVKAMIELDTEIQLIKKRNIRLVIGDNNPRLYHTFENDKDPKPNGEEESFANYVEFQMEAVPSYLILLNRYPKFVKVNELPLDNEEDRISFSTALYENGLLMTKSPLPQVVDDFDWSTFPDIIPPHRN